MFPKKILSSFPLTGICSVNIDLIISNWHNNAKIEKHEDNKSQTTKYLLIEKAKNSDEINLKVRISEDDAIAIIKTLHLSEVVDDFDSNVTIFK